MQFTIMTRGQSVDVIAVENALYEADPAAVVDLERASGKLRVSTSLGDGELLSLINQSGISVASSDLERLPADCCGGCGG